MRNKIVLRITSVAAALACAVWSLASCSSPSSGFENDEKNASLRLESLELLYTDGTAPADFLFEKETPSYMLNIPENRSGTNITVTASAADGLSVKITLDGVSIESSASFIVPYIGSTDKNLLVTVSNDAVSAEYLVTFVSGQSTSMTDYSLKSVSITYVQGSSDNLATYVSGANGGSAHVNDVAKKTAYVSVSAGSEKAAVSMTYNNAVLGSAASGQAQGAINLPEKDRSVVLNITVRAGNGNPLDKRTYPITVFGYETQKVTWYGTAAYTGTDYYVSGVTAQGGGVSYTATVEAPLETGGSPWYFEAGEFFRPTGFSVTLCKEDGADPDTGEMRYSYKQSTTFTLSELGRPGVTAADTQANPIAIPVEAEKTGTIIENANQLYTALNNAINAGTNYALTSSIDLSTYEENGSLKDWPGANNYAGKFYGNGHTINLLLSKKEGDTGFFNTLKNNAVIENFTLDVKTKEPFVARTGSSHFGGVVGYIEQSGATITIRNVTVKGDLEIGNAGATGYFLGGALLGEVKNVGTLLIENCASTLNITTQNDSTFNMRGIGGLIGRVRLQGGSGAVTIRNSYATGKISTKNVVTGTGTFNYENYAGGLIGDVGLASGAGTYTVTISNCYASGDVSMQTNATGNGGIGIHASGGLIGGIYYYGGTKLTVNINNCAAVNESALFSTGVTAADGKSNGRFAGYRPRTDDKLVLGSFTGNIARSGMLIGHPDNPQADDGPDAANEASTATTATGLRGAGKTLEELQLEATWTGMGWSTDVWDFSGLASGTWPTLKAVGSSN